MTHAEPAPEAPPALFPLAEHWATVLPAPAAAWPAYGDGLAFVPLRGGQLTAVSLADGSSRWTADLATSLQPAAGGGLVYVAAGTRLVAVGAGDGLPRWEAAFDAAISAPPLWDTGWLIAGSGDGEVRALRAADGREMWRRRLDAPLRGLPAVAAERVYLPLAEGTLASLDLLTGEPVWRQTVGASLTRVLALEERLYAGSTDNFLYCLSLRDGSVRWRWRTGADVVGMPQVDERRVYFVSLDNILRALDRTSGVQQWTASLPVRPSTGVLRLGPLLLVSGLRPQLHAYLTRDGASAGTLTLTAELAAPPYYVARPGADPLLVLLTTEVSGQGRLVGYGRGDDPPIVPLDYLPGATPGTVPLVPLDYLPGLALPYPGS